MRRDPARSTALALAALLLAGCPTERAVGAQCAYSDQCARGLVCARGSCRAACSGDRDCAAGARCVVVGGDPASAACVPPDVPTPCRTAADCARGLVCARDGACRAECRTARDCAVRAPYLPGATCGPDGVCAPASGAIARPVAPLSTATVTSHRPTLRWTLGDAGFDGADVVLCRNRAMSTLCTHQRAGGTRAAPASDLTPGVWFWQLEWLASGAPTGMRGPVWQFTVTSRTSAVDTSWGTQTDVNGDGVGDVVVGAPDEAGGAGRVYIYRGSPAGVPPVDAPLTPPAGAPPGFGGRVNAAGDVNGDGFADVAIVPGREPAAAPLYLYYGGPSGLGTTPGAVLAAANGVQQDLGVVALGDADGDGYADLAVRRSLPAGAGRMNDAAVLYGAPTGVRSTATVLSPQGPTTDLFGAAISDAGDVNGDGFADLVVGAAGTASGAGAVYLYLGSATGVPPTPSAAIAGASGLGALFGETLASAGDVNGDGLADLVIGAPNALGGAGVVSLYYGATTPDGTRDGTLTGVDGPGSAFGNVLAGAGDLDGNGLCDVVVTSYPMSTAVLHVYLATAGGLPLVPSVTLTNPDPSDSSFGERLVASDDLDGNGTSELVVGASGAASRSGRVYLYRAQAMFPLISAWTTLGSPSREAGGFGTGLATLLPRPWPGARAAECGPAARPARRTHAL